MKQVARMTVDAGGTAWQRARDGERIEDVRVYNAGNGVMRVDRPVSDIALRNVEVDGAIRVFETFPASGQDDASVDGMLIENVGATGLRRGFARIGYDSRHGIIRNVRAQGIAGKGAIPCGITFEGSAHDFSIEDCMMSGFRTAGAPERYSNGDGYSAERDNYGLRFLRCEAWDCSDGGFDLKSTGTFLDGCVAGQNKYNYRFWSSLEAHVLTSVDPLPGKGRPGHGHVSITADDPVTILIERLIARSANAAPLFTVHRGVAEIVIKSHDLGVPPGTPLVGGAGKANIRWQSGTPRI